MFSKYLFIYILISLLYLFSCSTKTEKAKNLHLINKDSIFNLLINNIWQHEKTIADKEVFLKEEMTKLIFNKDSTYNYIIDYNYVKLDQLTKKGKWVLKSDKYILLKPNDSDNKKELEIIKLSHDSLILKSSFLEYKEVIIYMISKGKRIDKTK